MKRGTPEHPKTLALAAVLGRSRLEMIGLLEMLWHFAGRYAQQGDIGRWDDTFIAKAVLWDGEPGALIAALVKTGWLDTDRRHRLLIHDWQDHADQATRKSLSRSGLQFATSSRRRPDRVHPASGPPEPSQAKPSQALPEPSPATTADGGGGGGQTLALDDPRRVGAPGELERAQQDLDAGLKREAAESNGHYDELLVRSSRTPNGRVIASVFGCTSLPWLRNALKRLTEIRMVRLAEESKRHEATPKEQRRFDAMNAAIAGGMRGDGTVPGGGGGSKS